MLRQAKRRLIFEELLILQLGLLSQRSRIEVRKTIPVKVDKSEEFYKKLPFEPTTAQKRAVSEAISDLMSEKPMNRLVQGDVGSGKTAVAAAIIYTAIKNGFQSAFMAPTEVLANQHFKTLENFFKEEINIELLTGSTPAKKKREIKEKLESGECQLVVGTHAMIQNDVIFKNLGLVVTDEQHRFGVAQRGALKNKSRSAHLLVMSATPIPRTLAMTLYGDLEVSVIDELPPGRQPIRTYHYFDAMRLRMFGFLRQEIAKGRQVYIVYPLIKESEKMDYKDLYDGFESISRDFPLPKYRITVCHGKMKPDEKDAAMAQFKRGEADILIAAMGQPNFVTADMVKEGAVVIDVGINRLPDGKLCGDVDFAAVEEKAAAIAASRSQQVLQMRRA